MRDPHRPRRNPAWHVPGLLLCWARPMRIRAILACISACGLACSCALAQTQNALEIESLTDDGRLDFVHTNGNVIVTATTPVLVRYGGGVLTADSATINRDTGEVAAAGKVRIQRDDQLWAGDRIQYNFHTRQMQTEQFRTGRAPVFAGAYGLSGDITNRLYTATNAFVTADDYAAPFERIAARRITITDEYVEMRHATLYLGGLPVFYFPYYKRRFDDSGNRFHFVPGYRSRFGAFLLNSYNWFLNDRLDGSVHADYRTKRGVGAGADFNVHLDRWGEASLRYYYAQDDAPSEDLAGNRMPDDRQRVYFAYLAEPVTNVTFRSQVRYQSDALMTHDFFEGDYRQNPQPNTFFEATKFWDNFALDLYAQPRVNDFLNTVERLPEVKLTGWRQQLGASPLYYESESSAGFYHRRFAETNGVPEPDYDAFRGDAYHQVVLPWTFFDWLNVTPRVGGRFTYYSEATATNTTANEIYRGVFNTGAEVSLKASRTWAGATNGLLQLDGLRHIVEPSLNYVYVPRPNERPWEIPQFDSELPSLRLLPLEFPDYNAVDSVDTQNALRLGLRNRLQTKRGGQVEDWLEWSLFTDWRLKRLGGQQSFSDLSSDLSFRPRSWLTFSSETRFNVDDGQFRLAFHTLTLQPNNVWNWSLGHYYLRDDFHAVPTAWGDGNDLITSRLFYRLNENWAARIALYYEARDGRMQEQLYTLYRDFRSWTGALTFRVRDNRNGDMEYAVAFTFSLKMSPRYKLGDDTVRPYGLIDR